jgi:hypothetical protein
MALWTPQTQALKIEHEVLIFVFDTEAQIYSVKTKE